MKIGFIDYVFDRQASVGTNGLSEVVWNLAAPMAALGHEIHVAGPYRNTAYPSNAVNVHTFKPPPINYRNIVGHILIVHKAIKTLQQYGPFDVIHAPEYLSTAMLCWLARSTPVVLTEPGNIYDRIANGNPYDFITTQVLKIAAHKTAHSSARIIATSGEMAYWWGRTGTHPERIARIPLGTNLDGFYPVANARERLSWDNKRPQILFAARLSVETGAEYLIRALPAILKQCPTAQLQMVGSGRAESSLKQLAEELKVSQAINWHGWVNLHDLATYYSAADVMVFPGTSGGTPRVMLQAMACGTPFVGSAIGGITDHIQSGVNGLLVPQRDVAALAKAVITILSDPLMAGIMAERANQSVKNLAWPVIAERVLHEVYQPITQSHMLSIPVS